MAGTPNIDLGKLVSVAQAPVSLVIATSIFLHMLTSRYVPLFDRLRALTGEYRDGPKNDSRQHSVGRQIRHYVKRIRLTQTASMVLNFSDISFIGSVSISAASVIYPQNRILQLAGMGTMATGIMLLSVATAIEIFEVLISRSTLRIEMSEFPNLPADRD